MGRLKESETLLDDLEENLSVFDIKLRHMREDIAAIEARNNRLELQTRNNNKLLATLEGTPPCTLLGTTQAEAFHEGLTALCVGW